MAADSNGIIGVFDSGVGGLSVLRYIRAFLPGEEVAYLADQVHIPYGPRTEAEIRHFARAITRFLLEREAKIIVVACNTASAAALVQLRQQFPDTPIVGMEPAVKPGANQTRKGKIGVLATPGTFGSLRYASLMARYAQGVEAYEDPCEGLVEQIEMGRLDGPETEAIVRGAVEPMVAAGVDTLVLGCTHYPFVLPLIKRLAGADTTVIDPAPAVARQVVRVLENNHILRFSGDSAGTQFYTSGDTGRFDGIAARLLEEPIVSRAVTWRNGKLVL